MKYMAVFQDMHIRVTSHLFYRGKENLRKGKKLRILKIQEERANLMWIREGKAQIRKKKLVQKKNMVKMRK